MSSMGPYVPDERIFIYLTLSNGAPQSLALELQGPAPAALQTLTLADGDLVLSSGRYQYSFVGALTDVGLWKYRFRGIDSQGLEFACPPRQRWEKFEIK